MDRWFDYESGYAWCESAYKYQTVPIIAEFANTLEVKTARNMQHQLMTLSFAAFSFQVTNLPLIVLPLVNVLLIRPYIENVNWVVVLPHLLLTVNGIASSYYHATLNLFGQLVDEISILWLLTMCVAAYLPVLSFYPRQYNKYIGRVRCAIAAMTAVMSTLCFVKPSLNALVLMLWSIPCIAIIHHEGANSSLPQITSSPWKISVLWIAASICWISDRMFCDFWLFLGTPYFHALFHLLSSLAAYNVFVMFSFIDIYWHSEKHPYKCRIKHFPEKGFIGVPYIVLSDLNSKLF